MRGFFLSDEMKEYCFHVAIAFDQLLNALFCGTCDETLSSRAYRLKIERDRCIPYYLINLIFFWQEDHCKEAYESEINRLHLPGSMR